MTTTKKRGVTKIAWLATVLLAEALVAVPMAWAHHDPSGCFGAGVDIDIFVRRRRCSITINRACSIDADCPGVETCQLVGLTGAIAPCETIFYEAILSHDGDPTKCAFEGGVFTLELPDGSTTVNGSVPCLGGTTAPCVPGQNTITTGNIPYTVNPADFNPGTMVITATATYAGGDTHDGGGLPDDSGDTPDTASATQGFSNGVISCNDNNVCTNDICNDDFNGSAACQHSPIVCEDNDPCTLNQCNVVTGCFFPPGGVVCNDNDPCTSDQCVGGVGCVFTPGALTCNDNDPCTSDACVAGVGCVFTPGALTCNDNDPCTSDACVPGVGCVFTPGALTCNDNDVCTNDQCVAGVGCTHDDISASCNDNDPCTDDLCDPILGCQNPPNGNPSCNELNHFQCYEIKPFQFARRAATVQDRYGSSTVSIRSPDHLCAPSDKRGEDPTAPTDPEHLTGFPAIGGVVRVPNQVIENQFGTVQLDLIRRAFLLVPTAKSLVSQPPPLVSPVTDHFQCYVVRRSIGQPRFNPVRGVSAVDQFGSHAVDLLRPRYFCAPANKNNEDPGAQDHPQNLLCYKTRHRAPFTERNPFVNNQFLQRDVRLIRRLEFCVPTRLVLK